MGWEDGSLISFVPGRGSRVPGPGSWAAGDFDSSANVRAALPATHL